MVKSLVVRKGKFNPDYLSVIIQFEETDEHFFNQKMNWMPKHNEIADYLRLIFMIEPREKQDILFKQFNEAMEAGRNTEFYKKDLNKTTE
jgi:hypothetical protein